MYSTPTAPFRQISWDPSLFQPANDLLLVLLVVVGSFSLICAIALLIAIVKDAQ